MIVRRVYNIPSHVTRPLGKELINRSVVSEQRIAILFLKTGKPITLKHTNRDLNKIKNEVPRIFHETLSFVDWLVSMLNFVGFATVLV